MRIGVGGDQATLSFSRFRRLKMIQFKMMEHAESFTETNT
jgi:hypothetical protein